MASLPNSFTSLKVHNVHEENAVNLVECSRVRCLLVLESHFFVLFFLYSALGALCYGVA
jgi:hypothetical protein